MTIEKPRLLLIDSYDSFTYKYGSLNPRFFEFILRTISPSVSQLYVDKQSQMSL